MSPALFERPVVSGRVVLSHLAPDLLTAMTWLEGALAPEWTLADLDATVADGGGVLISDAEGAAIGMAIALRDVPETGCATLPFLAIDPVRRFRGLGGEAGLALDARLRSHGFEKVYAPVPEGRGLAVYFWLRLGFRPLTTPEWPGPLIGLNAEPVRGIWMLRDSE